MKVPFKLKNQNLVIEFILTPIKGSGFTAIAKTSKDLDKLQDLISASDASMVVQTGLQKYIEKKIKLPIDFDHNYNGAGYGFKIDIYSILKTLK